ncbi:MAG: pyrroline-5-carboxylate reductase [Solirubrobacteraceae bacterium]|nr:pyrroline-5-carboxylate reductase [Solirubrobacteraceae bacterium]
MARAMARGWSEPVLATDAGSGRAAALAAELGGEAVGSNAELAERVDLVVLCHKPAALDDVAAEIAGQARAVASVLAGTSVAELQRAYPDTPVFRFLPNTPVELGRGVVCYVRGPDVDPEVERDVLALFGRLGSVVEVDEAQIELAMALMSCAPAYLALVAQAQIDSASRRGMGAETAARLVIDTMAGTAELLRARGGDAAAVRREVASPGGYTERGLAVLERARVGEAFEEAIEEVAGSRRS